MHMPSQSLIERTVTDGGAPISLEPTSTLPGLSKCSTSPSDPKPSELFQYLPDYKAVVCVPCQYAVQPNAVARHLKEIHQIYRSRRNPFLEYTSQLRLDPPGLVIQAPVVAFPIPELPVLDGLRCKSEGCHHLCASGKRMRTHWLEVHGRSGTAVEDWDFVLMQTIFRGNLLRYFTGSSAVNYNCSRNSIGTLPVFGGNGDNKPRDSHETLPSIHQTLQLFTLDKADALLLHHFITSTSIAIATDVETQFLWSTTVPQLATRHTFLLHGMLACAAFHLARLHPSDQSTHLLIARTHQDLGMPAFRIAIANVTPSNCDAVFIFSHLLVINSFASSALDSLFLAHPHFPDASPTWLYFLRNTCSMVCGVWSHLQTGPIKCIVDGWDNSFLPSANHGADIGPDFAAMIPEPQLCDLEDGWPEDTRRIYHETSQELVWAFSSAHALGERLTFWDVLRVWPMRISDEYLDLLGSGHPGALILLAHFCILLKKLEKCWYLEGQSASLLEAILGRLDEGRWGCVKWPAKEVGIDLCSVRALGSSTAEDIIPE